MAVLPWDYIEPPAPGSPGVPNLPCEVGRELGRELVRLGGDRLAASPRCDDCALRAGTVPNGSPATLANLLKCLFEPDGEPFYCHKKFDGEGEPVRLCAGYVALKQGT